MQKDALTSHSLTPSPTPGEEKKENTFISPFPFLPPSYLAVSKKLPKTRVEPLMVVVKDWVSAVLCGTRGHFW
jgi:hypothetical protein